MIIKIEVDGTVYRWEFSDLEEDDREPYNWEDEK